MEWYYFVWFILGLRAHDRFSFDKVVVDNIFVDSDIDVVVLSQDRYCR